MTSTKETVTAPKILYRNDISTTVYEDGKTKTVHHLQSKTVDNIEEGLNWAREKQKELGGEITYFVYQKVWSVDKNAPETYSIHFDLTSVA